MRTSFVFLADGFEDIEALTAVDVLRRAQIDVKIVSITPSLQVKSAHGVIVTADILFDATHFTAPDWLILPGGMPGATNLFEFAPLTGLLRRHAAAGGKIAAICAAPAVVLGQLGLLKGQKATCYPGFESLAEGAQMVDAPVVISNNFVLGNGPANALLWALAIVKEARSEQDSRSVANGMLFYPQAEQTPDSYDFG